MKRFAILFTTLLVSYIGNSCFKENNIPSVSNSLKKSNTPSVHSNIPPVYSEISDANFKAYLKTIVPLAFTPDNKFISNHPSVVSYNDAISIRSKKFTSLSGIEYFTSLTRLDCMGNQLTTLDVSKNKALTVLFCGDNQLASLDVSKNTNLTELECSHNQLDNLDVSKNTNLIELNCYWNKIKTLTIGENKVLRKIICSYNQLTILDVSKNTSLISLYSYRNPLTTLDVSKNRRLAFLSIDYSIKCCHPSIKAFSDRGGDLSDSFSRIPPFTCP